MNKKALVIDGNSLAYRAFYATLSQLEYYKQRNLPPVNALKLFLLIVLKIIDTNQYEYALIAFDHHKKTFRNDLMPEYKAGRKPMPDDLFIQLDEIKEAIKILGIKTLSIPEIEADDIIASYTQLMSNANVECDVYSSDRDLLQLVNDLVTVNMFKTGISDVQSFNIHNFSEQFKGLIPSQIPDYKAIAGDNSDNLCGIKGIGEVTAANLLHKFSSFNEIYDHLDELNPSQKQKFIEHEQEGRLCLQLATVRKDVLNEYSAIDFIKQNIDQSALEKLINKYHFKNFEKFLNRQEKLF